jgi:TM2 domain-containing membrane protein YozV
MYCSQCGTEASPSDQACPKCGAALAQATPPAVPAQQPQVILVKSGKSSGLAAVLSFLWCGLGQIYNGQIGKGLLFAALYFLSFLLILAVIGLVTTPVMWIWGMVDAYNTAERINRETGLG